LEKEMFSEGDLLVYGNIGICRVDKVAERDFAKADEGKLFYFLKPLFQDCDISTPVDNSKVFMRKVISEKEANKLIGMISEIKPEPCYSKVMKELTNHYESYLETHDCLDMLILLKSLYAKKEYLESLNRKFGEIDKSFMIKARELLDGEFSVALGIPKDSVQGYIEKKIA